MDKSHAARAVPGGSLYLAAIAFLALCIAGCSAGAGSGSSGNNITVSIANKIASVQAGTPAIAFAATVQNDSTNSGVSWSLTAGGSDCSPACGTLSLQTPLSVTYTPPASSPSSPNNQPTLTATSVAKTSKSDSNAFTIGQSLIVTIANKVASVNTAASPFVVNATVQNDSTNSGVNWALTVNGSACTASCGTLTGVTKTSVTYNPPSSPISQVKLTATSAHDNSKSDSNTFSVNQAPISVSISDKVGTVYANTGEIFFVANVVNDSTDVTKSGVTWTLTANGSPCSPACGTLPSQSPGQVGINYTPPTSVPASPNNHPTLTATSNFDGTKSDADTFSIIALPPISVTISQISSGLAGAGGITFDAKVQNDPSASGVTWSLSCAPSTNCGSLSGNTATTVVFTPPATAPAAPNNQATITATSVADGSKSGSDILTVTSTVANSCGAAGGSESLMNGHYALLMEGFEGSSTGTPIQIAASLTANGAGGITGGEEDVNDTVSAQHLIVDSTAGRTLYTIGADHRGCLQLTNTGGSTSVFRFAIGGISSGIASRGRILEFDDQSGTGAGGRSSGILRLQDSNSFVSTALQSQYAFGVGGWAFSNNQFLRLNAAGMFGISSGSLAGVDDIDFAGILFTETPISGGSIGSISPTTGRATMSFDIFDWAIYVINSSEFFLVGTDPASAGVPSAGRAVATGNSFTAASLSGNYVVHTTGNTNGSADASLQLLAMTPGGAQTGTISGNVYSYSGGSGAQTSALSGVTYNVDPTSGRTILGNPGDNLPIFYLTTPTDGIGAFVAGLGADALFGIAEPQTSTALAAGTYAFGTDSPADNTVTNKSGVETVATGGIFTGTYDRTTYNSQTNTSTLQTGQTTSGTIALGADGTGNIGAQTIAITSGARLFSIDESSGTAAAIVTAEQ